MHSARLLSTHSTTGAVLLLLFTAAESRGQVAAAGERGAVATAQVVSPSNAPTDAGPRPPGRGEFVVLEAHVEVAGGDPCDGEIIEFDWIGPDASTTQSQGAVASSHAGNGFDTPATVFNISGCSSRRVKMFRAVVLGTPWEIQPPPLNSWTYNLKLWQGAQSYFNAGGHPNSATITVTLGLPTNNDPYIPPPCNGELEYLCPWTYSWFDDIPQPAWVPLYEFKWDLSEAVTEPLVLPPGEWMAVLIATNVGQNNSGLWMSGSNAPGGPTGAFGSDQSPAMWNVDRGWGPNWPHELRTISPCGSGTCEPGENSCNCPQDCGAPPSNEVAGLTCGDGIDNDCDKATDCADAACATDAAACPNGQIPAVSEWGMVVLALLTLTAGTLLVMRRRVAA